MRLQYPTTIRIIEVPCTGKVDIMHLLLAFEQGADGVVVVGCLEGECHYRSSTKWGSAASGWPCIIFLPAWVGGSRKLSGR
jgi:coenzyme F420-reducing hydrogenase delta subunit